MTARAIPRRRAPRAAAVRTVNDVLLTDRPREGRPARRRRHESPDVKTGRPDAAQQKTIGPSRSGTSVHTTPSAVTPEWGFSVSPRSSTSADASDKPVTSGGRRYVKP